MITSSTNISLQKGATTVFPFNIFATLYAIGWWYQLISPHSFDGPWSSSLTIWSINHIAFSPMRPIEEDVHLWFSSKWTAQTFLNRSQLKVNPRIIPVYILLFANVQVVCSLMMSDKTIQHRILISFKAVWFLDMPTVLVSWTIIRYGIFDTDSNVSFSAHQHVWDGHRF